MKYPLALGVALIAVLGAGCAPASTTPPEPVPPARVTETVGCTPKALSVTAPSVNATAALPLPVRVRIENGANPECRWTVFEAQAGTMRLLDAEGVTVGVGTLTATSDWMTDDPVEYTGEIPALSVIHGNATLVITEEDPSGEGDVQEVRIPVTME